MTKGRTTYQSKAISDAMKKHWVKRRQKMALAAQQGMVLAKRNRKSIARNVAGRSGRPGRENGSGGGGADSQARVQFELMMGDIDDVRNRLRDLEDKVMSLLKTAIPLALPRVR